MNRAHSIAVVLSVALAPVLACGQSGSTPPGAVNQALNSMAQAAAAQAWSGTVTITQSAQNSTSHNDVIHHSTTTQSISNAVTITMTKGIASAKILLDLQDATDLTDNYDGYSIVGTIREHTVASGANNKDASVKVSFYDDGRYEIEYRSGGIVGQYTKVETSQTVCSGDPSCKPTTSTNSDSAQPTNQGFVSGGVFGTYAKNTQPRTLSGSMTEPLDFFSGSTAPGKTTVTWNLTR